MNLTAQTNLITAEGIVAIVSSLKNLQYLDLDFNEVRDEGAMILCSSGTLKSISLSTPSLTVVSCSITAQGVIQIAKQMPQLMRLYIGSGLIPMMHSFNMAPLTQVTSKWQQTILTTEAVWEMVMGLKQLLTLELSMMNVTQRTQD